MNTQHSLAYYAKMLDDLGDDVVAMYDREEAGYQGHGIHEDEQAGGSFTFSAMSRDEQVLVLHALDANFPTHTATIQTRCAPTSYAIKHALERYTGFYCSNLQCKTAMRILGFKRSGDDLNPHFNISKLNWYEFRDRAAEIADRRNAAAIRMDRQREAQKCARYFARMSA